MSDPGMTRVLAAEGASNFGSMLSRLAIPWLAALTLQATPLQMATLLVADVVAAALGSLLLGAWVDRSGKRSVMLRADGARCALLALLASSVWLERVSFAMLVVVAAINGVLTIGFELARSAWMAQQLRADDLPRRNSQLSAIGSVSETAAFALGGWLFQWLGAALSLAIDGLSYAVSALCLRGVQEVAGAPEPSSARPGWRALMHEAAGSARVIGARPTLGTLAGIEALLAFGTALSGTSYMIFVSRDLALPTGTLGMIFALGGLGAVLGAAVAPRLGRRLGTGRAMSAGLLAHALGSACVPLANEAGWVAVGWLVAHQIVGDAGHAVHDVHDRTLRQTEAPADMRARVDAGIRSAGQWATLAGALTGGLLGTAFGTRGVLWLAVATLAAAAVLAMRRLAVGSNAPTGRER
jgi:MFS family permease